MAKDGVIYGKEVIPDLYGELKKTDNVLVDMVKNIEAFKKSASSIVVPSQGNSLAQSGASNYTKGNEALKERNRLLKALARQEERTAQASTRVSKSLIQQRFDTQKLNKLNKQNAILTSKYADAYDKLSAKLNKAKRNLKILTIEQGANAKATKKAKIEVEKYAAKMKQADNAAGDFQKNVGNYPNSFKAATSAVSGLATAFGLYSAIQISGQIYEQLKAIDAMNKALRQVTESESAFTNAQLFLSDVADEAGANIVDLTGSYTKFLASAKTTNLTTAETRNIFRQTAKAAGVLGLSTDDAKGSFRALEQILSKGKVQAEEIRGQLGERLPGAFQILARSMGLTTAELDKQLSLGNVLSEEVLPKFAEELERTYSLDKVERVQTLAAEQKRLGNAWAEFLQGVEGGEGTITRVLGGLLSLITKSVEGLASLTQSKAQTDKAFDNKIQMEAYRAELKLMQEESEKTGISIQQMARRDFFDAKVEVDKFTDKVVTLKKSVSELQELREGASSQEEYDGYNNALEEETKELAKQQTFLARRLGILQAIDSYRISNKTSKNEDENDDPKPKGTTIDFTPRVKKLDIDFSGTTDDIKKQLKAESDRINKAFSDGLGVDLRELEVLGADELTNELKKIAKGYEDVAKAAGLSAEQQSQIFGELTSTFANYYGLDLSAFNDLIEGKKASEIDYATTANSVVGAFYDSKQIKYDNDLENHRKYLDSVLSDNTKSDKQKEIAQRKFDKKEKEVKLKKAKADRDAILFSIAISTAQAIVKSIAASPTTGGLPFSAIAAAIGIAQAAVVASTPLPQFFRGKDEHNNFEGWGTWGEKRLEVRIDKYGGAELSPNKTTPTFIKRDDIIVPSLPQFHSAVKNPNSEVAKRLSSRLERDNSDRIKVINNNANSTDTRRLEDKLDRLIMATYGLGKRPINVTVEQEYTRY